MRGPRSQRHAIEHWQLIAIPWRSGSTDSGKRVRHFVKRAEVGSQERKPRPFLDLWLAGNVCIEAGGIALENMQPACRKCELFSQALRFGARLQAGDQRAPVAVVH
jgi:hypothetical protein